MKLQGAVAMYLDLDNLQRGEQCILLYSNERYEELAMQIQGFEPATV
jgi:hypothetical protein